MVSNVEIAHASDCKNIILLKLSYAVTCSILSQLLIIIFYIFIQNFNLLSPISSTYNFIGKFASFGTWLYLLLFTMVIFGQCLISSKDYIIERKYCSSRFQRFMSVFTVHNYILFNLHIFVGVVWICLFLMFSTDIVGICENRYCIFENNFYLIVLGAWTGTLYFFKVYSSDKKIMFPVIYPAKWLQFKSKFGEIFSDSYKAAMFPAISFIILYPIFNIYLKSFFESTIGLSVNKESKTIYIYFYVFMFSTLIYIYLNLMSFFYELFLTEPIIFPISSVSSDTLTLTEAIAVKIPIMQHLASLDLYRLSINSRERREVLFSLSQPGHHPQNWNKLVECLIKLLKEYTDLINQSTDAIFPTDKSSVQPLLPAQIQGKLTNYSKLRNMSCYVDGSQNYAPENVAISTQENNFFTNFKQKLGFNYLFGTLPEANIEKCLGDGQIIMWLTQGLVELTTASMKEDRYGIVQKDLPIIITTLVELKLSMEKLNKTPLLMRRGNDINCRMKVGILCSIKRSLYNVCVHFGPYLKDLNLKQDVLMQVQGFCIVRQ